MPAEQPEPIDEISQLLFLFLYEMQRNVTQSWQSLNMTMAQLKVMLTLRFKGPSPISKIAEDLNISHPTASQLVDRLVQAGYVERIENIADRRSNLAHLTREGEELAWHLWQGRMDNLHHYLRQLNEQDLAALQQGLQALSRIAPFLQKDREEDH